MGGGGRGFVRKFKEYSPSCGQLFEGWEEPHSSIDACGWAEDATVHTHCCIFVSICVDMTRAIIEPAMANSEFVLPHRLACSAAYLTNREAVIRSLMALYINI